MTYMKKRKDKTMPLGVKCRGAQNAVVRVVNVCKPKVCNLAADIIKHKTFTFICLRPTHYSGASSILFHSIRVETST